MAADHVRPEEGPPVPLLERAVPVLPLPDREAIMEAGIVVPECDPVEGLREGLVEVPEAGERTAEDGLPREHRGVADDLPLADRESAGVLARHDGAGDDREDVHADRAARAYLVDRDVLPVVARIPHRAHEVPRIRRDVR